MNTNTKELTNEISELAITTDCIIALAEGLAEMAHSIGNQKNELDTKRLNNVRNGLTGIIKMLDSEVASKLYAYDFNYDSIKGEPTKPTKKEIGA